MVRFCVALLGIAACANPFDGLAIQAIDPATGVNTQDTPVVISGAFPLDVRSDLDQGNTTVDDELAVSIDTVTLGQPVRVDDTTITGTVPANLALGPHDISVTIGTRTAVLPDGFVVTDVGGVLPPPMTCDRGDLDLRACFAFDGDLLDGSSYKNDLSTSAMLVTFVPDRNSGRALLTSTATYTAAATTSLDVGIFTIRMYVLPNTLPSFAQRMTLFDSPGRYQLAIEAGGVVRCEVSLTDGTVVEAIALTGVIPGVWQRVACTYDGNAIAVYIDGNLEAGGPVPGSIPATGTGFAVGHDTPSGNNFNGAIDELQVWGSIVAP